MEKYLFDDGKSIHFKRYEDMYSRESNSNDTGIMYKNGFMVWNKRIIPVQIHKKDKYAMEALKHRVKYCRVCKKAIGTKYHYYLQLVLEGVPQKKHEYGIGRVGLDIGTSTSAVVSKDKCTLTVIGET